MKTILLVLAIIMLTGCMNNNIIDDNHYTANDFSNQCLNGVVYYVRLVGNKGFMAPAYNRDGTLKLCKE